MVSGTAPSRTLDHARAFNKSRSVGHHTKHTARRVILRRLGADPLAPGLGGGEFGDVVLVDRP